MKKTTIKDLEKRIEDLTLEQRRGRSDSVSKIDRVKYKQKDTNVLLGITFIITLVLLVKVFFFAPEIPEAQFTFSDADIRKIEETANYNGGTLTFLLNREKDTKECQFYGIHNKHIKSFKEIYYNRYREKNRCIFILPTDETFHYSVDLVKDFNNVVRNLRINDESKD